MLGLLGAAAGGPDPPDGQDPRGPEADVLCDLCGVSLPFLLIHLRVRSLIMMEKLSILKCQVIELDIQVSKSFSSI